ncbi:uncharacterized protein LOC116605101 [Nematostella vectensis]|uniref:uncharacterized protein LOC116605101 n=1 Tax=Nematostella vectensis TaxID=45351 RepID=UPI002077935E|nr:uncharacterized protein LOC116605101 [Nematostella vectensis]
MGVEVTKVNKGELLFIDNPNYNKLIGEHAHLNQVNVQGTSTKDKLPIHIILGASEYAKVKTETAPKIGMSGQPVAELTRFGWTIISPGKEPIDIGNMLACQTTQVDYEELCKLDILGLEDTPTNSQDTVYQEFKEQLARDENGCYITGLPWKGDHPPLPSNKAGSLQRLASLTKKLERQDLTAKYAEIIEEQITEGIVEAAEGPSIGREFYIPNTPVLRTQAESSKLRIVYDGIVWSRAISLFAGGSNRGSFGYLGGKRTGSGLEDQERTLR